MQAGQIKNCIFVTGHLVCPELQTQDSATS